MKQIAEPKVCQLDDAQLLEEDDVLGLEIAMDHVQFVTIVDGFQDLIICLCNLYQCTKGSLLHQIRLSSKAMSCPCRITKWMNKIWEPSHINTFIENLVWILLNS